MAEEGILIERTPPRTPKPNGPIERSGGVLIARGTCLRLDANLPEELWPEIYRSAGYLINRSPTKQFDWVSPLERLHSYFHIRNAKPKVGHLRVYGCKVYILIKNRLRLDKLDPKAYIGYLIGYDATNIYRVWLPESNRVISTRDVTFDESARYDPSAKQKDADLEVIETVQVPVVGSHNWQIEQEDLTDEENEPEPSLTDRTTSLPSESHPSGPYESEKLSESTI